MSKRTIAKFLPFVILAVATSLFAAACLPPKPENLDTTDPSPYRSSEIIGTITSAEISESSGLAASKCQPGILWTHNDSGDGAFLYAIDLEGKKLGTWQVTNAANLDWEDIGSTRNSDGKCFLFIADTGNNEFDRAEHTIYRISEPGVTDKAVTSSRRDPLPTEAADRAVYSYPNGRRNAETLIVHPDGEYMYVITKRVGGPAGIYKLKQVFGSLSEQTAEYVGELSVPAIPNGFVTGGDISPDGTRVVICDYSRAYEYVLPRDSPSFDDIWLQKPISIDIGLRQAGEAVCYSLDGTSIFATSEKRDSPLIESQKKE